MKITYNGMIYNTHVCNQNVIHIDNRKLGSFAVDYEIILIILYPEWTICIDTNIRTTIKTIK